MRRSFEPLISRQRIALQRPLARFLRSEANSGLLLMASALAAVVWVNSPWSAFYFQLWSTPLGLSFGDLSASRSLLSWVNDGLMALFFLLVGLEIKRELVIGELSTLKKAALPAIAALGGMIVPAAIYMGFNAWQTSARGWGVPMATDIAFSLGVLALLGSKAPFALKVFLAAIAIVDDIGAVLVVALFYTHRLDVGALVSAGLILLLLGLGNWMSFRSRLFYMAGGVALWVAMLGSGIHATIAGVLLAAMIPARVRLDPVEFLDKADQSLRDFERTGEAPGLMTTDRQAAIGDLETHCEHVQMPLERIEAALSPWVRIVVVPLFALANSGVIAPVDAGRILATPAALGIVVGLVVGKPLGIFAFTLFAIKLGVAKLPTGVRLRHVAGVGLLAGIGFTMSLFIADLAFPRDTDLEVARLSILLASIAAGLAGWFFLSLIQRRSSRSG